MQFKRESDGTYTAENLTIEQVHCLVGEDVSLDRINEVFKHTPVGEYAKFFRYTPDLRGLKPEPMTPEQLSQMSPASQAVYICCLSLSPDAQKTGKESK